MFQKHWLLTISLTVLVCLHSICPLYCAAVGQISCGNELHQSVNSVQSYSSCCHNNDADSSSENENTEEDGNTCCLKNFEVILPEYTYRFDYTPISDKHSKIDLFSIDTLVMVGQEQLFDISIAYNLPLLHLTSTLSRRGPPYLLS